MSAGTPSSTDAADSAWLRAMPAVFVLIWSTGFIVARYGMPHAPPMRFLALRYAASIACFLLWVAASRAPWPRSGDQVRHLAVTGILMHAGYLGGVWAAVKSGMGAGTSASSSGCNPCSRPCGCPRAGGSTASMRASGWACCWAWAVWRWWSAQSWAWAV
jgi:hypothetical protein